MKKDEVMMFDEDGIPFGWEEIKLTDDERDELCAALDGGNIEAAEEIVNAVYAKSYDAKFGDTIH